MYPIHNYPPPLSRKEIERIESLRKKPGRCRQCWSPNHKCKCKRKGIQ